MKYFILIILSYFILNSTFSQSKIQKKYDERLTKEFIEYDKQYSFKEIKFDTDYLSVFELLNLKFEVEDYTSKIKYFSINNLFYLNWGNVKFDWGNVGFVYSKLSDIQLGYFNKEKTTLTTDEFYKVIYSYLVNKFGQPIGDDEDVFWCGNSLTINLSFRKNDGINSVNVLIWSNKFKTNPLNNL